MNRANAPFHRGRNENAALMFGECGAVEIERETALH
jgi:hypothetical protein